MPLPLLAASPAPSELPDPNSFQSIGWVVVVLVAIIIGLNYAIDLWQKLNPRRNPPMEAEFASQAALAKLEAAHSAEIAELKERLNGFAKASAESRQKVYERLGDVEQNLSGLSADLKNVQAQNVTMAAQIANLIGKVSAALALAGLKHD